MERFLTMALVCAFVNASVPAYAKENATFKQIQEMIERDPEAAAKLEKALADQEIIATKLSVLKTELQDKMNNRTGSDKVVEKISDYAAWALTIPVAFLMINHFEAPQKIQNGFFSRDSWVAGGMSRGIDTYEARVAAWKARSTYVGIASAILGVAWLASKYYTPYGFSLTALQARDLSRTIKDLEQQMADEREVIQAALDRIAAKSALKN